MDQLGDYRLRKRLAVGGMGEVYLGEKVGPEGFVKPVVLKCVLPQLAKDRAFVQLFLDEARLAALLNHPNIAQVYDFGKADNTYFIAMEYVPGYTVDDIRRKLRSIKQHMPLTHVANIASQVCQGLHYAHTLTDASGVSLGLVHRDVSPHNLIVSIDGSVKIVDFGIAKARAGLTRVQAKGAVGKFGYMSPEQSRGEVVDARSDLFSLGICLWELCTNERLHDPNLDRAPDYTPSRPVPGLDSFRAEVPRQFQQILDLALGIEAADRPPTAQAMHIELERFQAAMTHYAGNSALAQFIKDLVEGKVEEAGVEPQADPSSGTPTKRRPSKASNLDAAQKYEEVFGVSMAGDRKRSRMKAVPSSWQTSAPPRVDSSTPAGPRLYDLSSGGATDDIVPDIVAPKQRPSTTRELPAVPKLPKEPIKWGRYVVLLVLAAVVAAGVVFSDRITPQLQKWMTPKEAPAPLSTRFSITTKPPGASIFVDGEKQTGVTPLIVELKPELRQRVTAKLAGRATAEKILEPPPAQELRKLHFDLAAAGELRIKSVPPGATVYINNRRIEDRVTPMRLKDVPADIPLNVRVEVEGMTPKLRSVTVAEGKSIRIDVDLVNR